MHISRTYDMHLKVVLRGTSVPLKQIVQACAVQYSSTGPMCLLAFKLIKIKLS